MYFETYAIAVFDAEARERIGAMKTPRDYIRTLRALATRVEQRISTPKGLWRRIVERTLDELNIIVLGDSRVGYYEPSVFLKPKKRQIRGALYLQTKLWAAEAWATVSVRTEGISTELGPPSDPARATEKDQQSDAKKRAGSEDTFEAVERPLPTVRAKQIIRDAAKQVGGYKVLAGQLGCSDSLLYKLRQGKRFCRFDTLDKIAQQLGCSRQDLYQGK